jgi:carboxypeptidase Taq
MRRRAALANPRRVAQDARPRVARTVPDPMLTPSEAVGLRGKQIDGRIRRAAVRMPAARLQLFAERLRDDAWSNHVVYERDGTAEAVRIMLRPLAATRDQIGYVHHVCSVLTDALRRLGDLYLSDADVRRVLALDPLEAGWLERLWSERHGHNNPIYGRLDAVCDFSSSGWRDGLLFLEPNLSGIGGIYYAPVVEQLVMRDVVAEMRRFDPQLALELPRDQRELFMQALIEHAESLARPLRTLAFVEPKYERSGPDEQRVLARFIEDRYGIAVVHVDPRELCVSGGEVRADGRVVDLAYRDYEIRDLISLGREQGADLAPMERLFAENRIVSSLSGDFDHKSCWELLTDAELAARHFSPEERRIFDKHVLWTRILGPRRTTAWDGRSVELLEFARERREELVLKPNRSYGGTGVCLGSAVSEGEWGERLAHALRGAGDPHAQWVVQRAAPIPVFEFPVVDERGEVAEEPYYTVMGFAPTDHGLGVMCRVSQKQVVNVAQRGGIAALLLARDPAPLPSERAGRIRSSGARETFREKLATLRDLDAAIGLLGWDEETCLPEQGHAQRGEQLATLESLRHGLLLDPELADVAAELGAARDEDPQLRREVELFARQQRMASALPDTLVKAFARARSRALAAWEGARSRRDYAEFRDAFRELVELVRERGLALSRSGDAYDGLLDEHEPGLTRAELEPILRTLAHELAPQIAAAAERGHGARDPLAGRRFPEDRQQLLAEALLRRMGFDFRRGRVDRSSHPFTLAAGVHDVRLTLRFDPADPFPALFAALHEGGHALYDQGFASELAGTLLADAPSTGLHESQARLWENHVGRSAAFWRGILPLARDVLGGELDGASAEVLHGRVTRVQPGANRVEADELSYNLHVVLRTDLELALLAGHLEVSDLPGAWREKSLQYLGVAPDDDASGCLQDVHWALGAFGYFPSYTLGNLYAAMLWERLEADVPGVSASLERGELASVTGWLREHVHAHGARESAAGAISRITGQTLGAESFLRHVQRRYA